MSWKSVYLDWDSKLFGYPVYAVSGRGTPDTLHAFLQTLKLEKNSLVYFFTEKDSYNGLEWKSYLDDYRINDEIIFIADVNNETPKLIDGISEYRSEIVSEDILRLALLSGMHSRFKTDIGFQKNEFVLLYTEWIKNAVNKTFDEVIFIYSYDAKICGLITARKKNNVAVIGLLAVDPQHEHKGVGSGLIAAVNDWAMQNNLFQLQVKTQSLNSSAITLYRRNGFITELEQTVYHIRI